MTLTPVQRSMCEVIAENGLLALEDLKVDSFNLCHHLVNGFTLDEYVTWEAELDSHTLTEHQYNEWLKEPDDERKKS